MTVLKLAEVSQLDTRATTAADVHDALGGAIERGEVNSCLVVTEALDGELRIAMTDMTNTEALGLMEIAKANYVHAHQHNVSQADYEVDS